MFSAAVLKVMHVSLVPSYIASARTGVPSAAVAPFTASPEQSAAWKPAIEPIGPRKAPLSEWSTRTRSAGVTVVVGVIVVVEVNMVVAVIVVVAVTAAERTRAAELKTVMRIGRMKVEAYMVVYWVMERIWEKSGSDYLFSSYLGFEIDFWRDDVECVFRN